MKIFMMLIVLAPWTLRASATQPEAQPDSKEQTIVERWSADERWEGVVVRLDTQGVWLKVGQEDIPVVIPWFDVRGIEPVHEHYADFQRVAHDAWRAHARLIRGDYVGAEAIYNRLEDRYLWSRGAQGADVSKGLMLCRLDRGDRVGAIEPYLSWLGAIGESESQQVTGFDSQFGVFIDLVPVFGVGDGVAGIDDFDAGLQVPARQRVLLEYYRLMLDRSAHQTAQSQQRLKLIQSQARELGRLDLGLALIDEVVVAQVHPESEKRAAARKSLQRRIRTDDGTWIELWARLAIGVSLISEQETQLNEQGVIELIHIIVRLDHLSQPLAILASKIANEYLARTERSAWGNELILEAQRGWSNE